MKIISTMPPCFIVQRERDQEGGVKGTVTKGACTSDPPPSPPSPASYHPSLRTAIKQGCLHFGLRPHYHPDLSPIFVQHSSLCVGFSSPKGGHQGKQIRGCWESGHQIADHNRNQRSGHKGSSPASISNYLSDFGQVFYLFHL